MSCFLVLNHCFDTVGFRNSRIEILKKFLLILLVDHLAALSSYKPIQPWFCFFVSNIICSAHCFLLIFSLFRLSSEYLVSWCCSNKMRNCDMISISSRFKNLYKSFSRSLAKGFSCPWLNISMSTSRFRLSIAPISILKSSFRIFQDSNAALFSIWYLFDIFDTPPFLHTQQLHLRK